MFRVSAPLAVVSVILLHCGSGSEDVPPATCEGEAACSGPLEDGGVNSPDATVSDGESDAVMTDAQTSCTTNLECNDGNDCTDDRCDESGACAHTSNEAICDDNVYCNGLDHCKDGTCSVHAGDPCTSGAECAHQCSEAGHTCNVPAGTDCGIADNPCSKTTCDGMGACVGNPAADGTNCGGKSTICCNGNCITVSTATNCGGCGIGCASGSCISVASSGVYACGCESSGCPQGQSCLSRAGPDLCQCSTCTGQGQCKSVVGSQGAVACTY